MSEISSLFRTSVSHSSLCVSDSVHTGGSGKTDSKATMVVICYSRRADVDLTTHKEKRARKQQKVVKRIVVEKKL